jgi:hypothetical protein
MTGEEKALLAKINQGLPKSFWKRFDDLVDKREARALTKKEYRLLLRFTDRLERLQVERLKMMLKLARLRQTSFSQLKKELPIKMQLRGP